MTPPVLIITGASRGLGAATARRAAVLGAEIALLARSLPQLEAVAAEIRSSGRRALSVQADVSQPEDCKRAVDEIVAHFQRVDGLINNAGRLGPVAPLAESPMDDWQKNLQINLVGPAILIQLALPYLRASNGRLINVSSGAAVNVTRGWSAYSAAKAGLNHLTRLLAAEETEITSLSFRPGVVDTDMQAEIRSDGARGMSAEEHARFLQYHANGELLSPEIPAHSLAWLALNAPHEWSGEFISWNDQRLAEVNATLS